jgi:hypothetical protein
MSIKLIIYCQQNGMLLAHLSSNSARAFSCGLAQQGNDQMAAESRSLPTPHLSSDSAEWLLARQAGKQA